MSRSAFAARFSELVGEPVMQYVTRWRMQVALDWHRHDDVPIAQLAARLGYDVGGSFQPRLQAHDRHFPRRRPPVTAPRVARDRAPRHGLTPGG